MRSVVLTEPEQFETVERERPTPGPDDVLVAITNVGICGSDVHYYRHGRIGEFVVESPLVLGHESAGEVVAVGENVTDHAVGDAVALEPGVPCDTCRYCRRGEYNLCPDVQFMATPPHDGAFTEYVAWPSDFVHTLPEDVSTRAGALCEPLSVAIHATRRADVGIGDSVLITGCGPIGMLVLETVRAAGASDVLMADVVPEKLERARDRGADGTIDVTETDLASAVGDHLEDTDGVDVVIEASGAAPSIGSTTDAVRRGGSIVLVGLSADETVPIETNAIVNKELDVSGSFRFRNTYDDAIRLLETGTVDVTGIIDFEQSLSDLEAAFRRVGDDDVIKGMISVGSS